jgi:2-acylglycerol O-acyltransferase 2
MITWHPHGFIVFCPIWLLAEKSIVGDPQGAEWHCTGAPVIFKLPFVGEMLMLINGRPVDKKSLDTILGNGGTVAIQPGGMAEQGVTRHDQEQAVFPKNLGFIRMAIQSGAPILMLYVFGENQLFKRVEGMEWLTKSVHSATGLMFPMWTGKAGVPQSPFPLKTDIHCRWGNPVEVGPADPNPSEERVEEVFQQYLLELQRVFYDNCHECLPPDVAKNGLKIIRLDGKPVPQLNELIEVPMARRTDDTSSFAHVLEQVPHTVTPVPVRASRL